MWLRLLLCVKMSYPNSLDIMNHCYLNIRKHIFNIFWSYFGYIKKDIYVSQCAINPTQNIYIYLTKYFYQMYLNCIYLSLSTVTSSHGK